MLTAFQLLHLRRVIAREQTLAFQFHRGLDPWDFWYQEWRRVTVLLADLSFEVRAHAR